MWIKTHNGCLVNTDKLERIFCEAVGDHYEVQGLNDHMCAELGVYSTEQDAQQAANEIFFSMRAGNYVSMPKDAPVVVC